MIQILKFPLGPIQTNCYVLGCEESRQAAIIDPGWDGRSLAAAIDGEGWDVTHILLTHTHFDHLGGLAQLKETIDVPVYVHPDAVVEMSQAGIRAALFGMKVIAPPEPEEMLTAGQKIHVGKLELQVLYTPGHASGHVSFYLPAHKVIFSGDVLFQGSIGRTDLPGGDMELLLQTIQEKLLVLPDDTTVLSGHGAETTIGAERASNPFLRGLG